MEMRKAYAQTMAEIMRQNDKVVILDADLAKACGTTPLYKEFPDRCFDVGIAESNMVSVAVGMAHYGYIPFTHTFAPFAARRAYDQIAVGLSYGMQNVKIVGADPGVCATLNGGTHMSFEDVAAMRALANMLIFEPCDSRQLQLALPQIVAHQGPCYLRLMRKEDFSIVPDGYVFDLYKADVLKEGNLLTVAVSGFLTADCMEIAKKLSLEGKDIEVINVHTIKPLDEKTIISSAQKTKKVLVVENANRMGGLFSAVAETLVKNYPVLCDVVAIDDRIGQVGQLEELRADYGIDYKSIERKILSMIK